MTDGRSKLSDVAPRAISGALLVLIGSLSLLGLVWISNSSSPALERLLFDLGLALISLISLAAQAMVAFGLWLLWRALRERN